MTFEVLPGVQILATKKSTKTKHRFCHTQKHRVLLGTNLSCLDELKKHKFLKKRNSFIKVLHRYAFLPHKTLPTKYPFANKFEIFNASKQDLFWYLWGNFKRQSYTKIYHFFLIFFQGGRTCDSNFDDLKVHNFLKKQNFVKVLHRYAFLPHKTLPKNHLHAKNLMMF